MNNLFIFYELICLRTLNEQYVVEIVIYAFICIITLNMWCYVGPTCTVSEKRFPSSNISESICPLMFLFMCPRCAHGPTCCLRRLLLHWLQMYYLLHTLQHLPLISFFSFTSLKHQIFAFKHLKQQFPSVLLPQFSSRVLLLFKLWYKLRSLPLSCSLVLFWKIFKDILKLQQLLI